MKRVLVISSSFREFSNSDGLAQEFIQGARENNNTVEYISLAGQEIKFCTGCFTCQSTEECVFEDDASSIVKRMATADVLVFATPIYYFEMSGQMKTLLDRTLPIYEKNYKFKEIYLLATAIEEGDEVFNATKEGLLGWIKCFEGAELKGTIFAGGLNEAGEINSHPARKEAYEMGRSIS